MIITQRKREPPRGEREGLLNSSSEKLIPGRIPNMRGPESQILDVSADRVPIGGGQFQNPFAHRPAALR
jgi:hypothetical protein